MIRTKKDLKEYLSADYKAYNMKHPTIAKYTFGENYIMYSYVRNLRYLEYYTNTKSTFFGKLLYYYYLLKHRKKSLKYNINISPNTVGKGLYLVHPGFRRLGAYLHIGENCTILPMVLIGKKSSNVNTDNFSIGDNCYLGTGCIIMGPVRIGNNVTVAAGAIITKDIPDNVIVAGNPARIIKMK